MGHFDSYVSVGYGGMKMAGYASDFDWSSDNWELEAGASYDGSKALHALGTFYARNTIVADALDQRLKVYFYLYNYTGYTGDRAAMRAVLRHSQLGTDNASNIGYIFEASNGHSSSNEFVRIHRCDGSNDVVLYDSEALTKGYWYLLDFRVKSSGSDAYIAAYVYKQSDMSLVKSIEITDSSPITTPGKFGLGLLAVKTNKLNVAYLDNLEYYVLG